MNVDGVVTARTYGSRLRGLTFRRDLSAVRLWIPRCSSVHTCFMLASIDIIFLDRERRIVSIRSGAKPWRLFLGGRSADSVLEVNAGFARKHGLGIGDRIEWPG